MIPCRRAAERISGKQDGTLQLCHRARLGFHTLVCRDCRRSRHQFGAIEGAVGAFLAGGRTGHRAAALSPESKERLRALIDGRLDDES